MKQRKLIMAVLTMAMLVPVYVSAQNNKPRTPPDKAKYHIIGTMNYRNGQRWLDNPHSDDKNGGKILFEYDDTKPAMPTDKADLEVRFDYVKTMPQRPITKLDFWRYDAEVGEWIYDSEVRQGETVSVTKMQTNVMLVIDKSSSLKSDFPKVQEAAIEFVNQLYNASREKGVTFRVGIIAFSTIRFTEIRDISILDAANYNEIVSFIRGLKMENGTALYYSLDKALDMLEKDTRDNIPEDEYRESRIYAFTDGLDQASIDDKQGLTTPTEYYEKRLRPLMRGPRRKLILNRPRKIVRSTMVTVRGDDMTEKQIQLFDERAGQICDNVRKLDDMSKLVQEFRELAADLVNSNFILTCYIPEGASGLVGWTFRDEKVIKEKEPSKTWLGIIASGAYGVFEKEYDIYEFDIGLDIAWPLSSSFSLGASLDVGFDLEMAVRLGPLAKISFANNSALLVGGGLKLSEWSSLYISNLYLNVGYKFKSPWYIDASLYLFGGFGIGVGYSILGGR